MITLSNIKGRFKLRLVHVSVNLLAGVGPPVLRNCHRRRRRRLAYALTSNTASHDNHEYINP